MESNRSGRERAFLLAGIEGCNWVQVGGRQARGGGQRQDQIGKKRGGSSAGAAGEIATCFRHPHERTGMPRPA
jgi:hypothetical protein